MSDVTGPDPTPIHGAPEGPTRCGFVALMGAPNVGKSTLVNALVGAKVSIVSRKVQTTRAPVRGIALIGASQLVLVDTPGIFAPKRRLERAMVTSAWGGAGDADLAVLLLDAKRGIGDEDEAILSRLPEVRRPMVLVLNKTDTVPATSLLALAKNANELARFEATFMLSALKNRGVDDLGAWLAAHVPPGPWHYPADQVSDAPLRHLAAEITREKLFERLHDELPYRSTVETESWKVLKDGSARVEQTIFVERENQRMIVLGEKGRTIRAIGAAARAEIAEAAEHPIHLFLFVKVRENWSDDPERYRMMGLEYPRD